MTNISGDYIFTFIQTFQIKPYEEGAKMKKQKQF